MVKEGRPQDPQHGHPAEDRPANPCVNPWLLGTGSGHPVEKLVKEWPIIILRTKRQHFLLSYLNFLLHLNISGSKYGLPSIRKTSAVFKIIGHSLF